MSHAVTIESLGHQGDGVAFHKDRRLIVPFALPEEEVSLDPETLDLPRQEVLSWIKTSPQRQDPTCQYFGECGGCSLQHMTPDLYYSFKTEALQETLKDRHITLPALPLATTAPAGRRRTTLSLYKKGGVFVVGYKQRSSLKITTVKSCSVLDPVLNSLLPDIEALFKPFVPAEIQVKLHLTRVDQGIDMVVSGLPALSQKSLDRFLADVRGLPLISRITWDKTCVYQAQPVTVTLSGYDVPFPAGGFLQPSKEGEQLLVDTVLKHLPKKKGKVVELFSGLGTFTLPMAAKGFLVTAFESDQDAVNALKQAAAHHHLATLKTEQRDLYRYPLTSLELNKFELIVLDPPRTGAEDQVRHIMKSTVKTVIMVTCNPATFGRDAQILQKGGYVLESLQPVDQFVWTPHLEAVAVFKKK